MLYNQFNALNECLYAFYIKMQNRAYFEPIKAMF